MFNKKERSWGKQKLCANKMVKRAITKSSKLANKANRATKLFYIRIYKNELNLLFDLNKKTKKKQNCINFDSTK